MDYVEISMTVEKGLSRDEVQSTFSLQILIMKLKNIKYLDRGQLEKRLREVYFNQNEKFDEFKINTFMDDKILISQITEASPLGHELIHHIIDLQTQEGALSKVTSVNHLRVSSFVQPACSE